MPTLTPEIFDDMWAWIFEKKFEAFTMNQAGYSQIKEQQPDCDELMEIWICDQSAPIMHWNDESAMVKFLDENGRPDAKTKAERVAEIVQKQADRSHG